MTIILCGGGSGGHITPLLAVASELKKHNPSVNLIYIGEKGGKFSQIAESSRVFNELHYISAGKFRRYHGESFLRQILDFKTLFLNIRDLFKFVIGTVDAYLLLRRLKPSAGLLKGGFVCVPVALAARMHNVPFITHDSDALPGLSNRIAARWARYHATALPAKYYGYPNTSVKVVGVPTDEHFREYSKAEKGILREKFGAREGDRILLITGGSNGARRLNESVIKILPKLLEENKDLFVLHQIGAGNEDQIKNVVENTDVKKRVHFFDFSDELFHMSAIADVIVTRAGASAMADYSAQSKACIVVPNPYLTGGHQLKNAEAYQDAGAALVVTEKDMSSEEDGLNSAINRLLNDQDLRTELGTKLHNLSPNKTAARELAQLLIEVSK